MYVPNAVHECTVAVAACIDYCLIWEALDVFAIRVMYLLSMHSLSMHSPSIYALCIDACAMHTCHDEHGVVCLLWRSRISHRSITLVQCISITSLYLLSMHALPAASCMHACKCGVIRVMYLLSIHSLSMHSPSIYALCIDASAVHMCHDENEEGPPSALAAHG